MALELNVADILLERDGLAEGARRDRRHIENLESQLRAGGYELEERTLRSDSLAARVSELQAALTTRIATMHADAEITRERQLTDLRQEHQLQLEGLSIEHAASMRQISEHAQRVQTAAAVLLPRSHRRRILGQCFQVLKATAFFEEQVRTIHSQYQEQEASAKAERAALTDRLLAAEATASAALTAATRGQEAAAATAATSDAQCAKMESEVRICPSYLGVTHADFCHIGNECSDGLALSGMQLRGLRMKDGSCEELIAKLQTSTAEVDRLSDLLEAYKGQIDSLGAQVRWDRIDRHV